MTHIVVIGAGLGGSTMAFELRDKLRPDDRLTVVNQGAKFHFVPSNPWVAVGWRKRGDLEVDLAAVFARRKIDFEPSGVDRVDPAAQTIALGDGRRIGYDYLVLATGPDLAFDEIPGLGPDAHTQSICQIGHAERAAEAFERFALDPGPILIGAAQGASCFGPAYEFALILDTELRRRKLRDRVPMTFVTPEPYIGHLGLDGVGDTKALLESKLREHHIKWIVNARFTTIEPGMAQVEEIDEGGAVKARHEVPFRYSMVLPAFRGVAATRGIEGLVNPRGFIQVDRHQRNPRYPNIFAIGVCVAIPPLGKTPVPVGVPKTGFMIESMVRAVAENIGALLQGGECRHEPTLNAVCLADFGDGGVAFVAQPQIPPRNINWSSSGKWVHAAKIAFEKYFLAKVRRGESEPFYERLALDALGIGKLKVTAPASHSATK